MAEATTILASSRIHPANMRAPLVAHALALFVAISHPWAGATEVEDLAAKKRAIRELVASQNPSESWPALVTAMSARGAEQMRLGVIDVLQEAKNLSDADRARLLDLADQIIPQASRELFDALMSLDGKEVMEDVSVQVYGKYFTTDELTKLAKFYSSQTGKKLVRLTPTLLVEMKNSGGARAAERYFTPVELAEINAFNNSPPARRMQETAAAVRQDGQPIYAARTSVVTAPVMDKYKRRLAEMMTAGR